MIWVREEKGEKLAKWELRMMNSFMIDHQILSLMPTLIYIQSVENNTAMDHDEDEADPNAT